MADDYKKIQIQIEKYHTAEGDAEKTQKKRPQQITISDGQYQAQMALDKMGAPSFYLEEYDHDSSESSYFAINTDSKGALDKKLVSGTLSDFLEQANLLTAISKTPLTVENFRENASVILDVLADKANIKAMSFDHKMAS